jgi:hypothetical protein
LAKSKGRPGNLSERERSRVKEIVSKLEPLPLARDAGSKAIPFIRKRR